MMKADFGWIEKKLKKYIDEKRYIHTKGVEYTAACLAMKYGYEEGLRAEAQSDFILRARLAGLLHDNAKCMEGKELLAVCQDHNLPVSDNERKNPFLLHGKVGAYYAEKRYEIHDAEILSAIACHTTGKPNMTTLEKIVFVADYIEPGRSRQKQLSSHGLEKVRFLAMTDLNRCVYQISEDTLLYLNSKNRAIDDMTRKTRDYYKQ